MGLFIRCILKLRLSPLTSSHYAFNWLRLPLMDAHFLSGDGKEQTSVCLSKPGPVSQKSIYLAEQGGRSRPGLKNWVSGPTLTFSALSTRNESAPSSGALRDTGWATGWKEQWGVVLSHKPLPCGAARRALVSPHASTAHEQRGSTSAAARDQGHYGRAATWKKNVFVFSFSFSRVGKLR